ncbi:MAG: hypothetical protein AAFZ52_18375, partial [Bacteroidota bacterium]
ESGRANDLRGETVALLANHPIRSPKLLSFRTLTDNALTSTLFPTGRALYAGCFPALRPHFSLPAT